MLHQPKKRNKSLARLREIIRLTQADFAQMIGVSLDLIKGIETGRNQLTQAVAARIFVATGADVSSLREGAGKVHYLHIGLEYNINHFNDWTKRVGALNQKQVIETFDYVIGPHMLLLLIAATRPLRGGRVRNRLALLLDSWARWEADAVESFGLKHQIVDVTRQCSHSLEWAGTKWNFEPGLHSVPIEIINWLSRQRLHSASPASRSSMASR